MAGFIVNTNIHARDIMKKYVMVIKLRGMKQFAVRARIARFLFWLAARIVWTGVEFVES